MADTDSSQSPPGETQSEVLLRMIRLRKTAVDIGGRKYDLPVVENVHEVEEDASELLSDTGSSLSVSESDSENIARSLMNRPTRVVTKGTYESVGNKIREMVKNCRMEHVADGLSRMDLNNDSWEVAYGTTKVCTELTAGTDDVPDDDVPDDEDDKGGITFCKGVPMSPEDTWDFSVKAINPFCKSKCQWIEGAGYQKFLGECLHEMRNTVCSCKEKKTFTTCKVCKQVFCSVECFKLTMNYVEDSDDVEPKLLHSMPGASKWLNKSDIKKMMPLSGIRSVESKPKPVKFKDVGTNTGDFESEARSIAEDTNKQKQTHDKIENGLQVPIENSQIHLLPTPSSPAEGIPIPPRNLWPVQILRNAGRGVRIRNHVYKTTNIGI